MKPIVTLHADQPVQFSMRTIGPDDIELLRNWKNDHRQFFFHKDIITVEQQELWYQRWSQQSHDHMFIVEAENQRMGCVGTRLLLDKVDIYNLILGEKQFAGKGIMSQAWFAAIALSQLLYPGVPIGLSVLQTNPAIGWHERHGFTRIAAHEEYVEMKWTGTISSQFQCNMTLSLPFRKV